MIGAAAAEGTATPPRPAPAPAAAAPAPTAKSSEMTPPASSTSSAKFINSQRSDQFLASNFKGTDVLGPDGKKVGDVTDILFDKQGKILAYVVGVGGFLGIGSKNVALDPAAFQVVAGDPSKHESDKLKIAMSKDDLKQAAAFEAYRPPSTTGMGSASPLRPSPRPSGGLAR
jgi:sporulation protein YlmC with PRC-barrel domain